MSEYLIQGDTLTGIADAIREKVGSSDGIDPAQMAELIKGIQSGGGAPVVEKEVNFYDYDGTLLYSYTVAEAQALTELPAGPEHEGLIFQGWNWSLESVKALTRAMNIGALYTTDDGTTRLYIHLEEGRTSPMLGVCPNGTVTVDWGDGTTPDTLTGTSTSGLGAKTPVHDYAEPGDYVIRLIVASGKFGLSGNVKGVLKGEYNDNAYKNAVRRVELGDNVSLGNSAFDSCLSLKSVTFPDREGVFLSSSVTGAFQYCSALAFLSIPKDANVGDYFAASCYALKAISLPPKVLNNVMGSNAFYSCALLDSLTIPDGITSIGASFLAMTEAILSVDLPDSVNILPNRFVEGSSSLVRFKVKSSVVDVGSATFRNCAPLAYVDFSELSVIPTLSSTYAFNGLSSDFEIRVPAALYDEWIAATNWSTYASQIVAV